MTNRQPKLITDHSAATETGRRRRQPTGLRAEASTQLKQTIIIVKKSNPLDSVAVVVVVVFGTQLKRS